jgi:uncharacterized protein (TIGR00369 family)
VRITEQGKPEGVTNEYSSDTSPAAPGTGGDAHASRVDSAGGLRPLAQIPFLMHLGALWRDLGPGRAELVLDQQPHHSNSLDMAHGGVIMTMLDVAMARAGSTLADAERGERSVLITIEMKTTFMAPAVGKIRAEGRVIRRTASMAFCEADLFDGHGHLAARASGTFRYLKQRRQ